MNKAGIEKLFEQRGIRHVKVGGFDIDGILRGKIIHPDKFWSILDKGFGFCDVIFGWDSADSLYDNSKVTGWHTGYPDTLARLDTSTLRILPQEPDTAHVLADFWLDEETPHPACPRNLLKRVIGQAQSMGYSPVFAAEFEFFLFRETGEELHRKGYRDLVPLSRGMFGYSWLREGQNQLFLHDLLDTMLGYEVPIEGIHTETGPGVYEAALRYCDALKAADRAALFKTTTKMVASRHNLAATFMAKVSADLPGCSGHLHQSLFDLRGEENRFSDPEDALGLSRVARHYLGGLTRLAPELGALYAPFVNSYKRYVPGVWAPLNATWAVENRTCAIRAITSGGPGSIRFENRQPGADINPYIAMAGSLAAGLWGVVNEVEPPAPVEGDATAANAPPLPRTLSEARLRLSRSEAARELLGEGFVDHYIRTRDWEVRQYERAVTDWEVQRYFESV